jgi:hypothetical protein
MSLREVHWPTTHVMDRRDTAATSPTRLLCIYSKQSIAGGFNQPQARQKAAHVQSPCIYEEYYLLE